MSAVVEPVIDVHLGAADLAAAMKRDVFDGLTSLPKDLPPKWLYDERGSEIFDAITRLDEYYPTRAERSILLSNAGRIIELADHDTIVELGSGTSDKTIALLDAAWERGNLKRFIPFDVSEGFLRQSAQALSRRYPGLVVHGVVGDFDRHLDQIPAGGSRLVVFLGGTIGNYPPLDRKGFFSDIVAGMRAGDHLLLGSDMVKSVGRMELAYDDPAGVTAAFTKNVLTAINRELRASFVLDDFDHVARWDDAHEWVDIGLRSRRDHSVRIEDLDLEVNFGAGEVVRTEVSTKFQVDGLTDELEASGLEVVDWFFDPDQDFGVSLSRLP